MKNKVFIFIFLALFSSSMWVHSQSLLLNNKYSLESSLFLSTTDRLPFWLRSNQYGEVPLESQFLQLGAEMQHEYDSTYNRAKKLNKFSFGYGARAIVNAGKVNQFRLTEGFAKVRYGSFEFYAGRRREIIGLVDTLMTSGSYIWSGNAIPIPKLQVSIPNYTPITKNKLLSIKASFSHGWFGNSSYVNNYWLHQKSLYLRIGRPNWKTQMYTGFNHQVQWGGSPKEPYYDAINNQYITDFGKNFSDYIKIFTGISIGRLKESTINNLGIPNNESTNRLGNHLGTIDLAIGHAFNKLRILIYKQNIYDDGSLFYLNNLEDGLYGLTLKYLNQKRFINGINIEILSTKNQGGILSPENNSGIPELRGVDNYFNNAVYLDGWSYKSQIIGSPFILNKSNSLQTPLPLNIWEITNNNLIATSTTISGSFNKLNYLFRASISDNYGLKSDKDRFRQNSFLIDCNTIKKSLIIKLKLAADFGELYNQSFGVNLGLAKKL
jgi:hypothetical protein